MWTCFMLTRLDRARESLRRYKSSKGFDDCPIYGYHNAETLIGEVDYAEEWEGQGTLTDDHSDPRWPTCCACGYTFSEEDGWQHNLTRIYEGDGWRGILREASVGAMWDASWLGEAWSGRDGLHLVVRLPDGTDWIIDGPANNGPGWDRAGSPPLITATPSIASPGYHGFLQGGVLTDDLEGRRFG